MKQIEHNNCLPYVVERADDDVTGSVESDEYAEDVLEAEETC